LGVQRDPIITGQHRPGDVRHCFADLSQAAASLGYQPRVGLEDGLREFACWFVEQRAELVKSAPFTALGRVG
jgi:dTDP-L-rhamnose 4-epimerase